MEKITFEKDKIKFDVYKDDNVWCNLEHESTEQIIDLIFKHGVKDKSVIDVGTGTGLLSILCSKLGASHVLALDLDTHALEWARKNFKRNDVEVDVEVSDVTNFIDDKADVIIANLPAPPQVENVKNVGDRLNDGGILILTWWNVLPFERYVRGFKVIEHIEGTEYDGYVLKKI